MLLSGVHPGPIRVTALGNSWEGYALPEVVR